VDPVSDKSPLGKPGPALEVEKWLSDRPVTEGKFVLLGFWAPWSPASRRSLAGLNALQKAFPDKLTVVEVSLGPESDTESMADPKPEVASALDSKGKLSAAAGITSIPCVILEDPKGLVLYHGHPAAVTEAKLQELILNRAGGN
jgi:cytochrome c biogenesis protein CcmG, thiol:disulfide interchange protein DsbE